MACAMDGPPEASASSISVIPYNILLNPGDHIILELQDDDIFEGDFYEGGADRIDLINTKQHNNPNDVLSGIYSFYRREIKKICQFKLNSECPEIKKPENIKIIDMTQNEYERLRGLTKNFIYLDNADKRYYDAIDKLKKAYNVGVVFLGTNETRVSVIKLLVMCTLKQVYLFDLEFKNRKLYPELQEIFESEYTCKIMHNAGPFIDILYRNYKVYCQNIFDTKVVDLIHEKNKFKSQEIEPKSISECLEYYFHFPASLLKDALAVSKKKWCEKPLKNQNKIFAAQLCVYLIHLKTMLEKKLFSRAYEAVENVHSYYQHLNDEQFEKLASDSTVADIEHLIPVLIQEKLS